MVRKQCAFSRNPTSILNLTFSRASDMRSDTLSWCWAAAAMAAPRQPHNHEGKHLIPLQPFCTQTTILFSLSVQYSINYMRYSTLYYKIGFVLDDFAQL